MKILVLTNLFPYPAKPHHGIFIKRRIQEYHRWGHEQVVVVPVASIPLPGRFGHILRATQDYGVQGLSATTVIYKPYPHIPLIDMPVQPFILYLALVSFIRKLHDTHRFDLIDAHYLFPDGVAASLLGRTLKVPVILSARGSDVNLIFKHYGFARCMITRAIERSQMVVSVSESMKRVLADHGIPEQKMEVVPNGVDPHFRYITSHRQQNPHSPLCRILMVGNLVPEKGQELFLQALKFLEQNSQLRINAYLIGTGSARATLRGMAGDLKGKVRCRLIGAVPHHRLPVWYNRCTMLCLLSTREGCPNVVLESLACGLPVLATDVGDLSDILHDGNAGLIIGERTVTSVAQGIIDMNHHTWDRENIARWAQRFSWEEAGKKLDRIFQAAAGR